MPPWHGSPESFLPCWTFNSNFPLDMIASDILTLLLVAAGLVNMSCPSEEQHHHATTLALLASVNNTSSSVFTIYWTYPLYTTTNVVVVVVVRVRIIIAWGNVVIWDLLTEMHATRQGQRGQLTVSGAPRNGSDVDANERRRWRRCALVLLTG